MDVLARGTPNVHDDVCGSGTTVVNITARTSGVPRLSVPIRNLTAIWFKFDVGGQETEADTVTVTVVCT